MINFEQALRDLADDKIITGCMRASLQHPNPPIAPQAISPDEFKQALCRIVVYQQLSTRVAAKIWERVQPLLQPAELPEHEALRACGLSNQKARYVLGILQDQRPVDDLAALPNEAVVDWLLELKGIGQWSAEMFLMFSLARADVFSIGDLGLRTAVCRLYDLKTDNLEAITTQSEQWRPHRTAVSLCLWHMLDEEPLLL